MSTAVNSYSSYSSTSYADYYARYSNTASSTAKPISVTSGYASTTPKVTNPISSLSSTTPKSVTPTVCYGSSSASTTSYITYSSNSVSSSTPSTTLGSGSSTTPSTTPGSGPSTTPSTTPGSGSSTTPSTTPGSGSSTTPSTTPGSGSSTTSTTSSTMVKDMESRIIKDMYQYLGFGCSATPKDASTTLYNSYGENTVSTNIYRQDTNYLNSVGYLQILLSNLNYYDGSIDKAFNSELNSSLQQFQKDYNLYEISSATPKTFDTMVNVLYDRCRGVDTNLVTSTDLNKIGIDLNQIEFNTNSKVKKAGPVEAQAYIVVPNDSNLIGKTGYFTKYQYNLLIAQVAHEAGSVSITNCYGVASAILNMSEQQYNGNVVDCINNSCVKFESSADALYSNYISKQDGSLYTDKRGDQLATAKIAVDAAISGLRAFSSGVQYWVGNGNYNRFSTTYKESANF